jgi:dTDP-6-deoxy-L-talose 4-dehydrogenase (NAD+)
MKVLVTGATGFIGSLVVSSLLKKGHAVVASSRSSAKAAQCHWFNNVRHIEYDLNDRNEDVFSVFGKPDIVIHAGWGGLPNYDSLIHIEENLWNSYFFIRDMAYGGAGRIVIIGTCLEYGLQDGCLSETANPRPVTPYGIAKDTLRKFTEVLQKKYNFFYNHVRLFYIYGEGQHHNSIVPQLERAIASGQGTFNMSGGEQLRDYLRVEEAAENIVAISLQNTVGGIVNCCSGSPISMRRFVQERIEERQAGIQLNLGYYPYTTYEPMAFWGCTERLKKAVPERL